MLGGAGVLLTLSAVTTATGELPEGWWWPTMMVLMAALLNVALGVVLGIAHLVARMFGGTTARPA